MPLDGTLQVTGPVALVSSFLQEELPTRLRHAEQKLTLGGFQHALLHLAKFDLQNLFKLFAPQRMKHHHLVQSVHEFRRKLAARRFYSRALYLFIQARDWLVLGLNKAHAALHEFRDFPAAEV